VQGFKQVEQGLEKLEEKLGLESVERKKEMTWIMALIPCQITKDYIFINYQKNYEINLHETMAILSLYRPHAKPNLTQTMITNATKIM